MLLISLMHLQRAIMKNRDDDGLPYVLECVREAEKRLLKQELNHEYAPIIGSFVLLRTMTTNALCVDIIYLKCIKLKYIVLCQPQVLNLLLTTVWPSPWVKIAQRCEGSGGLRKGAGANPNASVP